jgi:hypothetical protein
LDFHAIVAKSRCHMSCRLLVALVLVLFGAFGLTAGLQAQLESADRGIAPIDSSGTLEITGIHVDVGGKDAQDARYSGWRVAQRQGFKALWAKTNKLPLNQAPNLPDSVLDGMVSSIIIEREQIGPNRYIADLGVLFDRAKAGAILGIGGETRRSQPMLLIPLTITGGAATSVELKNAWQRAWAQFRTAQSAIDYVRVSGLGVDPLMINAAQTQRPGRGWWRNIVDLYGAADILVAEVQLHRAYPGGPARGRFIARHGPDNEIVGGFDLTARDGNVAAMMNEGVRRMDELFQTALVAGALARDSSLDLPPPPPLPEELEEEPETEERDRAQQEEAKPWTYQVQIVSPDANTYNFAIANLRSLGGVDNAQVMAVNIGGISYVHVTYRGSLGALASAMAGRGYSVENLGNVIRVSGGSGPPPRPAPPPQQSPVTPPQQQAPPAQQPPAAQPPSPTP